MAYAVEIAPPARRQIKKLPKPAQEAVIRRLEELEADPRPPGAEKLSGKASLYRVREGDYRIIYEIHDQTLIVLVVKVGHRGDVYRNL